MKPVFAVLWEAFGQDEWYCAVLADDEADALHQFRLEMERSTRVSWRELEYTHPSKARFSFHKTPYFGQYVP
jgi:hypothetical protein